MFLVKSCENMFNPIDCGTLRIGTLEFYRNTEQKTIVDQYEGYYQLEVNLSNIDILHTDYLALQTAHAGALSFKGDLIYGGKKEQNPPGHIHINKYQAIHKWKNDNAFMLSFSYMDDHKGAINLFEGYDDYWYFEQKNLAPIIDMIRSSLCEEICYQYSLGNSIFETPPPFENITSKWKAKSVHYIGRKTQFGNREYEEKPGLIGELLQRIAFIKPKDYKKEKEVRVVFDFFNGDKILHPCVDSLIINANKIRPYLSRMLRV